MKETLQLDNAIAHKRNIVCLLYGGNMIGAKVHSMTRLLREEKLDVIGMLVKPVAVDSTLLNSKFVKYRTRECFISLNALNKGFLFLS